MAPKGVLSHFPKMIHYSQMMAKLWKKLRIFFLTFFSASAKNCPFSHNAKKKKIVLSFLEISWQNEIWDCFLGWGTSEISWAELAISPSFSMVSLSAYIRGVQDAVWNWPICLVATWNFFRFFPTFDEILCLLLSYYLNCHLNRSYTTCQQRIFQQRSSVKKAVSSNAACTNSVSSNPNIYTSFNSCNLKISILLGLLFVSPFRFSSFLISV